METIKFTRLKRELGACGLSGETSSPKSETAIRTRRLRTGQLALQRFTERRGRRIQQTGQFRTGCNQRRARLEFLAGKQKKLKGRPNSRVISTPNARVR